MSTDNLMLLTQLQQLWPAMTGGNTAKVAADSAGGSDPALFLQALLQRMQTAVPEQESGQPVAIGVHTEVREPLAVAGCAEAGGAAGCEAVSHGAAAAGVASVPPETLVQRLRALVAVVENKAAEADGRGETAGKVARTGGNSLPAGKAEEADPAEPLWQVLQQWVAPVVPQAVDQPPPGQGKAGAESGATRKPAVAAPLTPAAAAPFTPAAAGEGETLHTTQPIPVSPPPPQPAADGSEPAAAVPSAVVASPVRLREWLQSAAVAVGAPPPVSPERANVAVESWRPPPAAVTTATEQASIEAVSLRLPAVVVTTGTEKAAEAPLAAAVVSGPPAAGPGTAGPRPTVVRAGEPLAPEWGRTAAPAATSAIDVTVVAEAAPRPATQDLPLPPAVQSAPDPVVAAATDGLTAEAEPVRREGGAPAALPIARQDAPPSGTSPLPFTAATRIDRPHPTPPATVAIEAATAPPPREEVAVGIASPPLAAVAEVGRVAAAAIPANPIVSPAAEPVAQAALPQTARGNVAKGQVSAPAAPLRRLSELERLAVPLAAESRGASPVARPPTVDGAAVTPEKPPVEVQELETSPVAAAVIAPNTGERPAAARAGETPIGLPSPVPHPRWQQELGERMTWLAQRGEGVQSAEIKLNPAHLGPLEVRVSVDRDQTSIQFVSQHAAVREAIEAAVPKLREMFGQHHLNLADVNVSQQFLGGDPRQPAASPQFDFGRSPHGGAAVPESLSGAADGTPGHAGETAPAGRSDERLLNLYV